jgi:preprotein translocase subunit YajC
MNMFIALTATGSTGSGLGSLIPLLIVVVLFGVMMFFQHRSQKKRDKETQDMYNGLSVGDEVTTIGGIIGKIVSIKEETCVIETTKDRTHIRILKTAVSRVDVKAEDAQD